MINFFVLWSLNPVYAGYLCDTTEKKCLDSFTEKDAEKKVDELQRMGYNARIVDYETWKNIA